MENHNGKKFTEKFPQLTLNQEAKDRIHSSLLHYQPESSVKVQKQGRFISIAAGLIGLLLFSVLTAYTLSQAEKEKADHLFATAEEQVSSVYETMQTNMKSVRTNDLLPPIKEPAMASAKSALMDAQDQITDMSEGNQKALKQELIPKLEEVEEYNEVVPSANLLQIQINDVSKMVNENPFNPDIPVQVSKVKDDLSRFSTMTNKLKNSPIKNYFQGRYTPQISLIENELTVYKGLSESLSELGAIADELSMPQGEFDQKVLTLSEKVGDLADNGTKTDMREKLNNISQVYERNQLALAEEKKRLEEKRKAEEKRLLAEKKKKEEEKQRLEEEKRKTEEEKTKSEEVFPMEFTEISPRGYKIIHSRRPYNSDRFYKLDEIAIKHGGRYYYTPSSDVAEIFNKDRKVIAFINYGFSTSLDYKDLFLDLYVYNTGASRDEAAKLIEKVIVTGEPITTGEGNGEGSKLWTENGVLHYDVW
jgi:hypothetical protein